MAREPKEAEAKEPEAEAEKPKTRKFKVRKGCAIFLGYRDKRTAGAIVELTAKQAKHFAKAGKHGMVEPYMDDD